MRKSNFSVKQIIEILKEIEDGSPVVETLRDKGTIFENLIFLKIKHLHPSYVYVDGIEIEIDFMIEDKTLIQAKYNSTLNDKQEKLYNSIEANKKVVIDFVKSFLGMDTINIDK